MPEQIPPLAPKKNRETVLLLIVLGVGLAGLAVLHFSRQSAARAAERALLQAKSSADNQAADPQASRPIQRIPGDLLRINNRAEAGTPYHFEMTNFAQGAIYELDPGDGTGRKALIDGKLKHTYRTFGDYKVVLYARYQGQEAVIDSMMKSVGRPVDVGKTAPIINY